MSNSLHVFNESCQIAGVVKGRCIVHCKLHAAVLVKKGGGC